MLGEETSVGFGIRSLSEKFGYDFPFKYIKEFLSKFDFAFGNLEVPLTNVNLNEDLLQSVRFRGSPNFAPILKQSGFNILSIANNHSMQFGKAGLFDCINHLNKNGIKSVGLRDEQHRTKMETIKIHNQEIGFIAYSLQPSEEFKSESSILSFVQENSTDIIEDVKYYCRKVDHLFVSLHWGHEFVNHPSDFQVKLGRSIIDAGARGVIGHHPHVLQRIEMYNTGIIVYSLGNFIFDQHFPPCTQSIILELELDDTKIRNYKIHPVKSNKYYQPELANSSDVKRILSHIENLSTSFANTKVASFSSTECYLEELKLKSEFQRLQNIYFLKNIYKIRMKFILNYIFKKISNLVLRKSYFIKYFSLKKNLLDPANKHEL
ncbi:MAG: CapA family protein [Bacteroidetes bacterium]|nr:CapA family protein [Bacteroidota bacterium]